MHTQLVLLRQGSVLALSYQSEYSDTAIGILKSSILAIFIAEKYYICAPMNRIILFVFFIFCNKSEATRKNQHPIANSSNRK